MFVSNAYGEDGKLMTGASPAAMVACWRHGGRRHRRQLLSGAKALAPVVEEYLRRASVPVLLKPNAGLPREENGRAVYDVPPEEFAEDTAALMEQGVRLAGGCCGTTPAYIATLVKRTRGLVPKPIEKKAITCISSYTHAVDFGDDPILIGERINPTGKKRFKEALRTGDMDYILTEASASRRRASRCWM